MKKSNLIKLYWISVIVIIAGLLLFPVNIFAEENKTNFTSKNKVKGQPYINPLWEEYMSLSNTEKKKWTVIPEKYIIDYVSKENDLFSNYNYFNGTAGASSYPSKYDLRNVDGKNYVTPLKNQSSLGLCWAFSSISSIETNALKTGFTSNSLIFSERQLDYASAIPYQAEAYNGAQSTAILEGINPYSVNRTFGGGGNFSTSINLMLDGISPIVKEGNWSTYNTTLTAKSLESVLDIKNSKYSVTGYNIIPTIDYSKATDTDKETWKDLVKQQIMNYGSVSVITLAPTQSYSGSCYIEDSYQDNMLINGNGDCGENYPDGYHAMSIIGWDDNYSLSYCDTGNSSSTSYTESTCKNSGNKWITVNGAWILKNSWGNSYSYPYLAYSSEMYDLSSISKLENKEWDNAYNEDNSQYEYDEEDYSTIKYSKIKDNDESLDRVTFKTYFVDKTYKVYISKDGSNNYELAGSVYSYLPGASSIDLNDVILDSEDFSIKITCGSNCYVNNTYAYTSNVTEDSNIEAQGYIHSDEFYEDDESIYIPQVTVTKNLSTGSKLTYKFYDSNNNLVDSQISVESNYVINNAVNSNIKITGAPSGKYRMDIIYNDNVLDSVNFNVIKTSEILPTSVEATDIVMDQGATQYINYYVLPYNTIYYDVTFTSLNTKIAKVDSEGLVSAVSTGNTQINICSTKDASVCKIINVTVNEKLPNIEYQTHIEGYGWQNVVKDGEISGTTGKSKRLEAIKINLENNNYEGNISYQTHIEGYGWESDWKNDGDLSGTTGESKRLEAIRIRLTGELAENYDVYYRVHAQTFGWLDWASNGSSAGTAGYSYRLEAIQIVLVKKGKSAPGNTIKSYVSKKVAYQTHVEKYGWESSWKKDGELSGTTGESKRLEAVKIRLTGDISNYYDIYYRVHAQTFGWLDWTSNGDPAGTSGYSYRLEAIQIKIVNKSEEFSDNKLHPYFSKNN